MEKEMLDFIIENGLNPFNKSKTSINVYEGIELFKTKDARAVHTKVLNKISSRFNFAESSNVFDLFPMTDKIEEINKRQSFFSKIKKNLNSDYLAKLRVPKSCWKPKYSVIVVTEDEKTFSQLKAINCPSLFLLTEYDVQSLENYEVVQVLNCDNFSRALENLPQAVFLDSIDDVYLERYLELISGWKDNLKILGDESKNESILKAVDEIRPLIDLTGGSESKALTKEGVESSLNDINREISEKIKQMTLSGEALLAMLSKNEYPPEIKEKMIESIRKTGIPSQIFTKNIPVAIDDEELERLIKVQSYKENAQSSQSVLKYASQIKKIPEKLQKLSALLIVEDFLSGISNFISEEDKHPEHSDGLQMANSKNIFLEGAQPISFRLDWNNRCSILTGANSGGKTTLLEHIVQIVSLFQLGLATNGAIKIPLFTEVYYFAKTKGSVNKGAFETLLTQMSKIKPGKQTLILADEIEAVTEPGVAGKIICATADYFIKKGCFLVIATHLGQEIAKVLPQYARVDGIEAKGLDEEFNLVVDHNPVLGRLANSTPELIVEKMAKTNNEEYFSYLYDSLKKI